MISLDDLDGSGNADVDLNPIYSQLNNINTNTSSLRFDVNNILSSISTLTISGGGFDYTEQFSVHSSLRLGYNVSDSVNGISLSDVIKFNFGPNCTFDDCTFNSIRSLTINDVVNKCKFNTIRNGKLFGDILTCSFKTCSMLNMSGQDDIASCQFSTARFVNITCSDFLSNSIYGAYNWNINCNNLQAGRFIAGDKVNINAFAAGSFSANNISTLNFSGGNFESITFNLETVNNQTGNMTSCNYYQNEYLNLCGESISGCQISECKDVNLNYVNVVNNTFSDLSSLNATCINMTNCNWNDLKQVNVNAYSLRDLTIQSIYDAHITASLISNMVITKMYSYYDISAFSIDWLQMNWDPWASTYTTTGTINAKAAFIQANIVGADDVNIKCDSAKAVVIEHCKNATISAKSIASGFCVKNVDDLDLWLDNIDLPSADADIYGLSSIGTLHIHQHSSYNGNGWNYLNNRPMAAFSNGVSCLDFDFKVPTYLINNGATTWNGAGYGYPGYHISDIYVNGVPYTCYSH